MIKKYIVDPNSFFNQSLILSLFERTDCGFLIDGLTDNDRKDLFPVNNKIKFSKNDVDVKSIPSRCVASYLDDDLRLKALLLVAASNTYYLFKVDPQNERKLTIHQKYISKDSNTLMDDYEKHCKSKGKKLYDGLGDSSLINDISYFEHRYKDDEKKHHNKESSVYRLTFTNNNMFTTDFVDLVEKKKITILSNSGFTKEALTLRSMEKNKNDRRDSLLIDSETKDISFFIFTYKPHFIKHYLVFENLGNNTFLLIKETICFNEIFALDELKDISFKNASEFSTKNFAKQRYENFSNEYIAFEEEEEFEEIVKSTPVVIDTKKIKKDQLLQEVLSIVKEKQLPLDIGITYHGKLRIQERIGDMSDEEMLALAKVAYTKGKTSAHFLEKDRNMFEFLSYHQGKKIGKTLRLYGDILFFFSLEAPHDLVTCFFYNNNYDLFIEERKKNKK